MNICPHCKASVNPLRLLVITRRAPYRCARCGGLSLLSPKHNTVAALLTLGAVVACLIVTPPGQGIPKTIACFATLYVFVIGGTMWLFLKLERTRQR